MNSIYKDKAFTTKTYKDRLEWLKSRENGIGGSDASALIGRNKWKTNLKLYQEKKGLIKVEDISKNQNVIYGLHAEEQIRNIFKLDYLHYEVNYIDNTILTSKKYPFMQYSADGLIFNKNDYTKGILEIKTSEIKSKTQANSWKDSVPDEYYIQILHGLLVTGFDFVVLRSQLKYNINNKIKLITEDNIIFRKDVIDDLEFLEKKEIEQYKYYELNEEPPLL